ncbi:hypothetical protein ANN_26536 [Periplaneta americana]|uniref:Uncharacterized protein n=1 Tax=Periplaneta americana TaxID=6978 RepID=A0ABQ8RYM9_PERAM|nr:hypothetical protein ANN_26536 [Periplaneta americana]
MSPPSNEKSCKYSYTSVQSFWKYHRTPVVEGVSKQCFRFPTLIQRCNSILKYQPRRASLHTHTVQEICCCHTQNPQGARPLAADRLRHLIDLCISFNSEAHWVNLMLYAYIALRVPEKSTNKSLISKIKENINNFQNPSFTESIRTKKKSPHISLAQRIERKIAEGDIRNAVRILSSDMGIAEYNQLTYEELLSKHPPPSRPSTFPDAPVITANHPSFSESDVLHAIKSFPQGSASGIDGLRPQHLVDLVSISAGDSGKKLLSSITNLCNFLSQGKSLIWDFTCVDTLALSHLKSSVNYAGSAAESAYHAKRRKCEHLTSNYIFVAFAVETFGPWCRDAKDLLTQIGTRLLSRTGDPRCINFLRQRIGIAVQRGMLPPSWDHFLTLFR